MFLFYVPSTNPYLFLVLGTLAILFIALRKFRTNAYAYAVACLVYGTVSVGLALALRGDSFDFMRLLSIGAFPCGFMLFAMFAFVAYPRFKILVGFFSFMCVLIAAIGIDAFLIEPKSLQMDHYKIESAKIKRPTRIAVLTDLQTDRVTDYEKTALERMLAEKPDIILMPGDYVQSDGRRGHKNWEKEKVALNNLFKEVKLQAPLGVYAVCGNCEDDFWPKIFEGTGVKTFPVSKTIDCGDFIVTGLTLSDSFDTQYKLQHSDKYHFAVGHGPDFALGNADADLLACGHTHGGQVVIPFYGPPMTLCKSPREWAKGCVKEIHPGTWLILSRGVGMERHFAPRMRFFCKPQIIIADVVPVGSGEATGTK